MSDSDIVTDMLILSEKLAEKKDDHVDSGIGSFPKTCTTCGNGYTNICTMFGCAEVTKARETNAQPSLKLFKVTVSMFSDYPDVGDREGVETLILDIDGPSAERVVLSKVDWVKVDLDRMVETEEIVGPFKAGHIIHTRDFGW